MRLILSSVAGLTSGVSGVTSTFPVDKATFHTVRAVWVENTSGKAASGVDLVVQGSIDGTNWYQLASQSITAAELAGLSMHVHLSNVATNKMRVYMNSTAGTQVSQVNTAMYYAGWGDLDWGVAT